MSGCGTIVMENNRGIVPPGFATMACPPPNRRNSRRDTTIPLYSRSWRPETDLAGRVVPCHGPQPRGPCRWRVFRPVSDLGPKSVLALEIGDEDPPRKLPKVAN